MSATIEAAKPEAAQGLFYADADAAEAFGRRLLLAHDLPEQDAARVAQCLVLLLRVGDARHPSSVEIL